MLIKILSYETNIIMPHTKDLTFREARKQSLESVILFARISFVGFLSHSYPLTIGHKYDPWLFKLFLNHLNPDEQGVWIVMAPLAHISLDAFWRFYFICTLWQPNLYIELCYSLQSLQSSEKDCINQQRPTAWNMCYEQ